MGSLLFAFGFARVLRFAERGPYSVGERSLVASIGAVDFEISGKPLQLFERQVCKQFRVDAHVDVVSLENQPGRPGRRLESGWHARERVWASTARFSAKVDAAHGGQRGLNPRAALRGVGRSIRPSTATEGEAARRGRCFESR